MSLQWIQKKFQWKKIPIKIEKKCSVWTFFSENENQIKNTFTMQMKNVTNVFAWKFNEKNQWKLNEKKSQ